MPTTFNAISLGTLADIDTVEGNYLAENAEALVGLTFGGARDALVDDFVSFSMVADAGGEYDMDNSPADQFSINGGSAQTYDGTAEYYATITYEDGTTANITAVIVQDTNGQTYLVPEYEYNSDQVALEAGPIQSITLDSVYSKEFVGTYTDRENWDYVTCFVRGSQIVSADGPVRVEDLKAGDMVRCVDGGLQQLRWVGHRKVAATGSFAPVRIRKGALGNTSDLLVSPQHRILLSGWRAELVFGQPEVLAPAKCLINGDTVTREVGGEVEYYHILFDRHELVYSAGIKSESFHPAQLGWNTLTDAAREEILTLFPEMRMWGLKTYGDPVRPVARNFEVQLLFR